MKTTARCKWAETNELFAAYHDDEWGVPVHDDRLLFEMLNLEGAQAGLSWLTILRKRDNYRKAFANFDAGKVARYGAREKARLLGDAGIVRNRAKVDAVIGNAKAFLAVQSECGSFDRYVWQFVDHTPITRGQRQKAIEVSARLSKDLLRRGFKFVGPTICFAFMQATGMVNDHEPGCFRYRARAASG
jgi:DNA-3-methyladenine glycosylase I